jgi:hypothetical protein
MEESLKDVNRNTGMNGLFKVLAKLRRQLGGELVNNVKGGNYIFKVDVIQDPFQFINGVRNGTMTLLVKAGFEMDLLPRLHLHVT